MEECFGREMPLKVLLWTFTILSPSTTACPQAMAYAVAHLQCGFRVDNASVVVRNCTFEGSVLFGLGSGGGLNFQDGSLDTVAIVDNCTFSASSCFAGCGISTANWAGSVLMTNCTFTGEA